MRWPSILLFAITIYLLFCLHSCLTGDERDDYDPDWGKEVIAAGKPLVMVIERFEKEFGRVPHDAKELVAYAPNAIPDAPGFPHWGGTCTPGFRFSRIDRFTYLLWVYGYPGLGSETDALVYHSGPELPLPMTRYLTVEVEPNWVYIVGFEDYTREFRIPFGSGTELPPSKQSD